MNYNSPLTQPYGLPYSNETASSPTFNMQSGAVPFLPPVQVPPYLQQSYPQIVFEAVSALQAEMTCNGLRMFLFNQMANNNWQNNDFVGFCEFLVRFIDLTLRTSGGTRGIPDTIRSCAGIYTQFRASDNVTKFPQLLSGQSMEVVQACQQVCMKFMQTVGQMENAVNGSMNMQQPMVGQPIGYGTPMMNQGTGRDYGTRFGNAPAVQSPVMQTSVFNNNQPVQSIRNNSEWRGNKNNLAPAEPVTKITTDTTIQVQRPSNLTAVIAASNATDDKGHVNAKGEPVHAHSEEDVKWRPSKRHPYTYAYDPNFDVVAYHYDNDGSIMPVVHKRQIQMDITKHLSVPSISPNWTPKVDISPYGIKIVEVTAPAITPDDIVVVREKFPPSLVFSDNENWTINDIILKSTRLNKENQKPLIISSGILVDPVITLYEDMVDIIEAVLKTTNIEDVVKILLRARNEAEETNNLDMLQALIRIDKRLTDRLNRFVTSELSLTIGTITYFMEDILSLPSWMEARFGEGVSQALIKALPSIIEEALTLASGTLLEVFREEYCEFLKPDSVSIQILPFVNTCAYATVGISSIEFRAELPKTDASVGVTETNLPLLYHVAKMILSKRTNMDLKCHRYFMRTSDGVVFELTRGALNEQYILIRPH